jgi:hypothetical protein
MIGDHDTRQGYCRKLGHEVTFAYCRQEQDTLPCPKIRDCWFEAVDIDLFLSQNYKPEEIVHLVHLVHLLNPAKPKMHTLIELIQQAENIQNRG